MERQRNPGLRSLPDFIRQRRSRISRTLHPGYELVQSAANESSSLMHAVVGHDGVFEPGVGLVRVEQLCRRKPRGAKVRTAQIGIGEISLEKIRSAQSCAGEI